MLKSFKGPLIVIIIVFAISFMIKYLPMVRQAPATKTLAGRHHERTTEFPVNSIVPNSAQSSILLGQKIDVNSATKGDFESLPGIGPSLAERIVKYRTQHGRFKNIDEMDNVSGIGPKTVERLKEFLK